MSGTRVGQARLQILAQRMASSQLAFFPALLLRNSPNTASKQDVPSCSTPELASARQMGVDSSGMPTDPKAFTFEKATACKAWAFGATAA